MTNKRSLLFVLSGAIIALFAAVLSGCGEYSDSLQRILAEERIIFGVQDNLPMSYEVQDEPNGYSVQIGRNLAARLDVEAEFVFVTPSDVQRALDEGMIDVYINLPSPGQKAMAAMLTVDCGMEYRQIMVVPSDSDVKRLFDLSGQTLCIISGSDASAALDEAEVFKSDLAGIIRCKNASEQFDALDSGKAQGMLIDEPMYRYIMNGVENPDYKILDELLARSELIMAMRAQDHRLAERIEVLMDNMRADGTIDSIRTEWLG